MFSLFSVGIYLSFRAVASQVFSAQVSLTAMFGMGTGGPSLQSAPTERFPFGCIHTQMGVVHLQGLEPWTP